MERKLSRECLMLGKSGGGGYSAVDNLRQGCRSGWYFSRKGIETYSPSRKDGVDSRKEAQLRMLYCSFLQDIGMKLRVPQVTIATAIMLCHRFYLHQSHTKNEWQTIATVCMFLASKVEDTPCHLDKVVIVAYEMMFQRDLVASQRIHQKDVLERQKALILVGETLVMCTTRFDFNIQHPYRPLHEAFKKLQITQKDVRQTAWNYVNDWFRTTLCLQYEPHYIAAGSLYLAAKQHNMKLPSGKGYVWWQEFNITAHQLDAVVQQMVELLGCKRGPVVAPAAEKPKPVQPQITGVPKEEVLSSPDSCVLSEPGSSSRSPIPDANEARCVVKTMDPDPNPCVLKDSESPDGVVEDCEGINRNMDQGQANTKIDEIGDGLKKINVNRIRTLMRARKRNREHNKTTKTIGNSSEDAWIERELEDGIELEERSFSSKLCRFSY